MYIGQSIDIHARYRAHTSKFSRGIAADKLQQAYNRFGYPIVHTLVECEEALLDTYENSLIVEFNSVEDGFNACFKAGGGCSLTGEDVGNSKYSNNEIEEVFLLLVNRPDLNASQISNLTLVSKDTIYSLSSKPRRWLQDKFPSEYAILNNRTTSRFGKGKTLKERGIVYPPIVSPLGKEYIVENTSTFAKNHNLNNGHLVQVLKGREKAHKGWRLNNG